MDILNQSWADPLASTKKFFSREILYRLSKLLSPSTYEIVLEGDLDLFNKTNDQPDIVIYQRKQNFTPVIAIELSTKARFLDDSIKAMNQFNIYGLKEFLIYNLDEDQWYSISGKNTVFGKTDTSNVLQVPLGIYNSSIH
ncbi:MAG TPA: hypothetical protein PKJ62_00065 [Bacteroidia bacterium]|nr:hypothetical protein [Bacteroidia bacterium]